VKRINILSESVKNKIAAGEVVEGPFSVIKELLENSIDAGAAEIDVEVSDGGLNKIVVKDNGCGIYRDDLHLSIRSHATSKITDARDIEVIKSYGFRGEALSSVSSISKFTILTRSADEEIGAKLVNQSGNAEIADYAGPVGTTVIVENLFFNVPARKKFLKAKGAELRRIRETFLKTAVANPAIAFSFSADGKRQVTLQKAKDIAERIRQVYGMETAEKMYSDGLKDIKLEISGFLSKTDFLKSTRAMQFLYVNGRPVEYKPFGFLLSKAYEAIAPKGTYPAAFIFITIDPALIDVNIHPAKREVKFFDQKYIDNMILSLAGKVLGERVHKISPFYVKKEAPDDTQETMKFQFYRDMHPGKDFQKTFTADDSEHGDIKNRYPLEKAIDFELAESVTSFARGAARLYSEINAQDGVRALGVVFNTYILVEGGNAVHFIDFHAAHERFIYDRLTKRNNTIETQALVIPQVVELSFDDYQTVVENGEYLLQAGFDIDIFSENSIVVRGIPDILEGLDIQRFFIDTVDSLKENRDNLSNIKNLIAEKMACHSAKRAGERLSAEDADMIAREAFNGLHELRCPHGRPYMFKLEKKDLEKVFKRV
jgi:DNA mismatch repair protein MutL